MTVLRHTVELRTSAAQDIQRMVVRIRTVVRTEPVQLLVDTVVMVPDIRDLAEVDTMSVLQQKRNME